MPQEKPLVAIVMGSESDMAIMDEAVKMLKQFSLAHEVRIISAHRAPERVRDFALGAEAHGLKVIIAAAGKAAHLAGVVASMTPLPVIGVPMTTSDLGGLDSLLSMVQMPGGVPVATVAIGKAGAKNAALLALQILAVADEAQMAKLKAFREEQTKKVEAMDDKIKNDPALN